MLEHTLRMRLSVLEDNFRICVGEYSQGARYSGIVVTVLEDVIRIWVPVLSDMGI